MGFGTGKLPWYYGKSFPALTAAVSGIVNLVAPPAPSPSPPPTSSDPSRKIACAGQALGDRLTIEGQLQRGLSGDGLGDSQGDFKALLDIA